MFDFKNTLGFNTEKTEENCLTAEAALSIVLTRKALNKTDLLNKLRRRMLESIKQRSNEGNTYKLFELDDRIPKDVSDQLKVDLNSLGYTILYYDADFMLVSWKK